MEEKSKEQLAIIEEMIAQSKLKISEGSIFYLLWGWLVVIAASINYGLLMYTDFVHHYLAWPILMTLGGIVSAIIGQKHENKSGVKTYVDRAITYLWSGFTISLIAILISMVKFGVEVVYPTVILLYGLGTFVSGGILKFKPLIFGAIWCWILGSIAVYLSFPNQLLVLIAAILGSYIVPGYLLANSKQNV